MTKYLVRVYEVHYLDIPVEAETKREACEKAEDKICNDDLSEYDQGYSYTLEKEDWKVEKV